MPNTSAVNAAPVNASAGGGPVGSISVGLRCSTYVWTRPTIRLLTKTHEQGGALAQAIAQTYFQGVAHAPLQLRAGSLVAKGRTQTGLILRLVAVGTARSAPGHLWVSVYQPVSTTPVPPGQTPPAGSVGGAYHTWCVSASAGQVTGTVTVNAEENGARTASLSVLGDATSSAGGGITLSLIVGGAQSLLYRGRIVRAQYNPDRNVTSLSCSDELQEAANRLSNAQIDALTPDAISPPGDKSTGYSRLMSRLSTVPKSAILRIDGSIGIVSWNAAGGGSTSRILHGAFTLERTALPADSGSGGSGNGGSGNGGSGGGAPVKRKAWRLTINLSWIRIAKMKYRSAWGSGISLCDWYFRKYPMPEESTISQAVQGCGWDVESLVMAPLPVKSQQLGCDGGLVVTNLVVPYGFIGPTNYAEWVISKRYTRAMSARAVWLLLDKHGPADAPFDIADMQINITDPRDGRDWADFALGELTETDANGDKYADLLDIREGNARFCAQLSAAQDQIDNAMNQVYVAVAQAAIKLAEKRRVGAATATAVIDPRLDIGQGLGLVHPKASFGGMIRRITHTLDTARGSATTTVEVVKYQEPETPAPTPPPSIPPGWPPDTVHTVELGNLTGGMLAKALNLASAMPTRRADVPLPHRPTTWIGGNSEYPIPDPTLDPLFQGWVANKPPLTGWIYGAPPPLTGGRLPNTGFFVRSPDLVLPDQNTPLNLGEALLLI